VSGGPDAAGTAPAAPRIACVVRTLPGGGGEEVTRRLARAFLARGVQVDLVARKVQDGARARTPPGARLIALETAARLAAWRWRLAARAPAALWPLLRARVFDAELRDVPAFAAYLRAGRPDAVLAVGLFTNLVAAWAHALARSPARLVLSEQAPVSRVLAEHRGRATSSGAARWERRLSRLPGVLRWSYARAHARVAVSQGVADDLAAFGDLPRGGIVAIPNPSVDERLPALAACAPEHPWFAPGVPAPLLAVGRLTPQKDFPTLLHALARLPPDLRLVILGEGSERAALEALAAQLGLLSRVALPGHVENPFAYLARARACVLSSRFEGFPLVLIEALACGCPVVSTDCPYGPAEILAAGRYGALVPVGDAPALADAIAATLARPPDAMRLRERARDFAVDAIATRYLALLLPGAPAQVGP
jgi:glycosyltransferase involved in cell wall biosynthesis